LVSFCSSSLLLAYNFSAPVCKHRNSKHVNLQSYFAAEFLPNWHSCANRLSALCNILREFDVEMDVFSYKNKTIRILTL